MSLPLRLPKKSYEQRFLGEVVRFEKGKVGDWGVFKSKEEPGAAWILKWKGREEWCFVKKIGENEPNPLARTETFFQAECYLHYLRMKETKEKCKSPTYTEGLGKEDASFFYIFKDPQGGEQRLEKPGFNTLHILSEKYD